VSFTVFLFSSQVAIPCLIGALITQQKARILDTLIDFPWFEMSRSKQKTFLQFIHRVQNTTQFIMPVFGFTIGIETITNVLNVSYSYFTFFWRML
jgi:hypothetical protein